MIVIHSGNLESKSETEQQKFSSDTSMWGIAQHEGSNGRELECELMGHTERWMATVHESRAHFAVTCGYEQVLRGS